MCWHPESWNWTLLLMFFCLQYLGGARTGRIKCFSSEDIPWGSFNLFKPPNQLDMVAQLMNFVIVHGIFCDETSSVAKHSCPCSPMSNTKAMLYQRTYSVLLSCSEPQARTKWFFKRSKFLPCGTLCYFHTGKVRMPDHYVFVPSFHVVNITLWKIESRRIPHYKHPCRGVQNLVLKDDDNVFLSNKALNLQLCGTAWNENILSSTRRVRIMWESLVDYPETSGFCLTYQPVAAGHANIEYHTDINEDVGENAMMTRNDGNLLVTTVMPSFFIKFWRGQTSTYVLSYTGGVLEVPSLRIHRFVCLLNNDDVTINTDLSSIAVNDWPTFPSAYGLNVASSRILKRSCSDVASPMGFNSTTGDLSITIFVSQHSQVICNGTIFHTPLPCPGQFCNLSTHTVPNNESIMFAISSKIRSQQQQRLILSVKEDNTGYILLTNFTVGFVGFTHYPCMFGGIFIYEFTNVSAERLVDTKSVSLLAKICSPWMAGIWNRGVEYSTNMFGLHFNVRPLLFVIKTYDHHSSSHIEGHASLSDCAGVVNFLFNPTPREYNIPNKALLTIPQESDMYRIPRVRHTQGCLIIQNLLWGDDYNKAIRGWGMIMNFTSIIKTQLPEHSIGISSNEDFLHFKRDFHGSYCNLHAYPVGITLSNLGTIRPPRSGYQLYFNHGCLFTGESPFVIMTYPGDEISTECLTSESTEKLLLVDDEESIYYVPIAICAILNVKGNMYLHDSLRYVILIFSKPYRMTTCCMFQININVKLTSLINIVQFKMQENYERKPGIETWWKIWNRKHILDISSEAMPYRSVRLFGEGYKMSSLFGDVFSVVELAKPVSSFGPMANILNISFGYTFWQQNVHIVVKSESSSEINHYCIDGGTQCYMLLNRNQTSWEDAKMVCEKRGLVLLSTPSDFEWKQFEALFANHKVSQGHKAVILGFLNLQFKKASLIKFKFIPLVENPFLQLYSMALHNNNIYSNIHVLVDVLCCTHVGGYYTL